MIAWGIRTSEQSSVLPPNQSLKLTAEAGVRTRNAQENELVVAARRQCWNEFG
jgi:hypothetical protein